MTTEKKTRSHWGWGYSHKLPDSTVLEGVANQMGAMLGFRPGEPLEPVPIEAIELAPSTQSIPESLATFVTDEKNSRIRHTYGRAFPDIVRAFEGQFKNAPDLVATPSNEDEIEQALEFAGRNKLATIPFGGGTSVVGGVECRDKGSKNGVLCLDMTQLNQVTEVDTISHAARIQAGCTGPQLEAQLAEHHMTLRHFPQSFEFSTLGGWLATRAGGHFATLYTHIDDLTESIRMLTPRGVMESRRLPASGAGPSPDRLVLGSEGTLGVITEAWMRIRPRPRYRASASVLFSEWEAAVDAVRSISQSGLYPSNCRLLDQIEAMIHGVSLDGTHVLLLGFESANHDVQNNMENALKITERHSGQCPKGAVIRDDGQSTRSNQAESWREAFFAGPYLQSGLITQGMVVDTFETAITWDRFHQFHRTIKEHLSSTMQKVCGSGLISCRMTHVYPDGAAPYYTFIAPAAPGEQLRTWQTLKDAASEIVVEAGGTITHHHAVGREHRPQWEKQRPQLFGEALNAVKTTLDPEGLMNPGVF